MIRKGQIVAVTFDDHTQGGDSPIRFVVYGEVAVVSRSHLAIDSWAYADKRERHDANETRYNILRSTIRKVVRLRPEE